MTLRSRGTTTTRWKRGLFVAGVLAAAVGAAPAYAAPQGDPGLKRDLPAEPMDPSDEIVEPGPPMPVPFGSFGYLATRDATLWLARQKPADRIRAMPVPGSYQPSNDALAAQVDRELAAAVRTPKACVQIIIDPSPGGGNLFSYGVWSVEPQYCP